MLRTSAALAALLQCATALRKHSSNVKVAGVPMLNYRYRHLQATEALVETGEQEYDWIIKFPETVSEEQMAKFCGGEAGKGDCWFEGHPRVGGLPLATVRMTETKLEKLLQRHPGMVEFVEPDSPVEVEDMVEQERGDLWGHDMIQLEQATYTGRGVHIYVMDTGIRVSHQDFGGRAVPTLDTRRSPAECPSGDSSCASDDNGHGTHVAGTAGGTNYGVATDAVLHAMKVCCGSGSNILLGMDFIAQSAQKPAVMTMSLGSYSTPESSRVAVDAVVNSGVTVTVSAGNRGTPSCEKSYTFIASALGVGAMEEDKRRASYSNYGECNAIFAPGTDIVSASYTSDTGTRTLRGTSMAAPHVAGAAALLLEEDGGLSPADVRLTLQTRAHKDALTALQPGDPNLLLSVRR